MYNTIHTPYAIYCNEVTFCISAQLTTCICSQWNGNFFSAFHSWNIWPERRTFGKRLLWLRQIYECFL